MNQRTWGARPKARRQQSVGGGATGEEEQVLAVPPLDFGARPQILAKDVEAPVALGSEEVRPIRRPLLVDVMGPALARNGS